jgi:tRNA A37 N6-isopentenylltransferase MiaA
MLEYTSTVNTNCVCRSSRFHSQAQVVANQEVQAESNEFLVEAKDEQLAAAANTRFANRLKNGFVAAAAASLVQLKAGKCMGYMKQHVCVYMLVLLL